MGEREIYLSRHFLNNNTFSVPFFLFKIIAGQMFIP
jgi:hypothetical protein